MTAIWKQNFQASEATRPASLYSWTGKSTMMILPVNAASGWMLVSVQKRLRSGRVMKGRTSIENDSEMIERVFSESVGHSWSQ